MLQKERKYHYIYKTTCIITGKYYVGMHSSDSLNDNYLGSGKLLNFSIRKYGNKNHKREILEILECRNQLKDREKEIVNEELLSDPLNINLAYGGEGGDTWSTNPNKNEISKKLSLAGMNRKYSEETLAKMRASAAKRPKPSRESIERAEAKRQIKRKTGNYFTPEGRVKLKEAGKQKIFTDEYRQKLSYAAKNPKQVQCPWCKRIGSKNSYARWHFDNCKFKSREE